MFAVIEIIFINNIFIVNVGSNANNQLWSKYIIIRNFNGLW